MQTFTNEPHKLIVGLLFHVKGIPAIMMATHPAPTILCNKPLGRRLIVDLILILHSEGAHASLTIVNSFKISFCFCEDCRIFCEGKWQVKDNGYAIVKQQSANIPKWEVKDNGYIIVKQQSAANIPDAGKKRQHLIKGNNLMQQLILPLILTSEIAIYMALNSTHDELLKITVNVVNSFIGGGSKVASKNEHLLSISTASMVTWEQHQRLYGHTSLVGHNGLIGLNCIMPQQPLWPPQLH